MNDGSEERDEVDCGVASCLLCISSPEGRVLRIGLVHKSIELLHHLPVEAIELLVPKCLYCSTTQCQLEVSKSRL